MIDLDMLYKIALVTFARFPMEKRKKLVLFQK
jgi:hypothetical protein